ncbi:MAG TPA: hypothetical protein VF720_06915 [Candidatus Eisenbacteria bacterium]
MTRRVVVLFTLALLVCGPIGRALAACLCSYGDGRFTTHTAITIDGAVLDWATVLLDTDNSSCDGSAPNVAPQPDRDAPVQSTGRDLNAFTYTWNNTYVQTLTGRAASDANVQRFIYYADTDNDGKMETGERCIVATWKGSNRLVELFLGRYLQVAAGGDPMVDINGYGDGYDLPGTITGLPPAGQPHYSGNWGTLSGVQMEWAVPWADAPGAPGLGIPAGQAFTFHVSSTNSNPAAGSFPAQVDDNMAGCGGGAATSQYAGLDFLFDRVITASASTTVYGAHRIINQGNGIDRFDLTAGTPTGGHTPTMAFYKDVDKSGTFTGGDVALTDTGGGLSVDTGAMAAGDTIWVLIRYVVASNAAGTATIISTARSAFDSHWTDIVTDQVVVSPLPNLVMTKTRSTVYDPVVGAAFNAKAIPAARVDYTIRVENRGLGTVDIGTVIVTDAIPARTRLYVGNLNGVGSGPLVVTDGAPSSGLSYLFSSLSSTTDNVSFSSDNGVSYTYTPVPDADGFDGAVTNLRVTFTGIMNATGITGHPYVTMRFRVEVR